MAEEGRVIRARRIELTNDRGDVTLVLEGTPRTKAGLPLWLCPAPATPTPR